MFGFTHDFALCIPTINIYVYVPIIASLYVRITILALIDSVCVGQ